MGKGGNKMNHLNGDIMCAVDVETTGLDIQKHHLFEVAILPLNSKLEPDKDILPFEVIIKPPEISDDILTLTHKTKKQIFETGVDAFDAEFLFEKWFARLRLAPDKKIIPLAHNWPFDRDFLRKWLGQESFAYYFGHRHRDTMTLALALNDWADQHCEQIYYPKVSLAYLAGQLNVVHDIRHEALADCVVTAEVYRLLIKQSFGVAT